MASNSGYKGWRFQGKLTGVAATVQKLRQFPAKIQTKVIKKATTKGAQITTKEVKQRVPTQSKLLKKSIGYKVRVYRQSGVVVAFIGARLGFKGTFNGKPRDPRYYIHLVEKGRKAIKVKKKKVLSDGTKFYGRSVAAATPKRPLARAFAATKQTVETTMIAIMDAGMQAEWNKA